MPGTIARLNAALRWDLDDFNRGTAHIEGVFGKLRSMVAGMAVAFEAAGRRMTLGITAPLTALAVYTVKAASDAQEMQSALNYTFGALTDQINKWAEDSGDAIGRSTGEMKEGALALGGLFNAAAPTADAAASLSKQFAELAQDAGSFFNVPFETALEKIRAGLIGEAEPLRAFNVFLSEAAVQAKALELGLIKEGEELNENGKIMARAVLITEALAVAKGDAARTADSAANRWKKLKSELAELALEIGTKLLPYAKALLKWAGDMVQRIKNLPDWVQSAAIKFALFAAALGPVMMIMTKLATVALPLFVLSGSKALFVISALLNPLGTAVVALLNWGGAWGVVTAALGKVLPMLLRLLGPIGLVAAALLIFKDEIAAAVSDFFSKMGTVLGPQLERMFNRLGEATKAVSDAWDALMQTELGQLLSTLGGYVKDLVGALLLIGGAVVIRAIDTVIEVIKGLAETVTWLARISKALFEGDWTKAWQTAVSATDSAIGRIAQRISWLFPPLRSLIGLMETAGLIKPITALDKVMEGDPFRDYRGRTAPDPDSEDGLPDVSGGNYGTAGTGKAAKKRSGPSPEDLARRREEIRLQHELDVARERGDKDAERALQRQLDLLNRIEKYERGGLSAAQAKLAAEKDMTEIDEARAEALAREVVIEERRLDMRILELRGDYELLRMLEDREFLQRQTVMWQEKGLSLAEAERRAHEDLVMLEEARAEASARRLADQEAAHQLELARLRGDPAGVVRAMEEEQRRRDRARDLQEGGMREEDAVAQAMREGIDRERAHLQGTFRDSFREGLRAALDGNLGNFFEQWMKDRTFNALADVLDRLATSLADMVFGQRQGGGGIGGFFGSLLGLVSPDRSGGGAGIGLFGGSSSGGFELNRSKLPGFDTGGRFRIKGFPGIDQNTLSLNGNAVARVSQGEIVDVQKGAGGGGGERVTVEVLPSPYFDVTVDRRIASASPAIATAGSDMAQSRAAWRGQWQLK